MVEDIAPTHQNTFLCCIGHICLQWALLEQNILGVIACAENLPIDKVFTRYAGKDMLPRLNLAISLANEAKWPQRFVRPLKAIRTALQENGEGLADKRNLFVHGVHYPTANHEEFGLVMARWRGDKRDNIVGVLDAANLAQRLSLLAQEAQNVFDAYGLWKFGTQPRKDRSQEVAETKTLARSIRAQNIKRGFKLILANLRP